MVGSPPNKTKPHDFPEPTSLRERKLEKKKMAEAEGKRLRSKNPELPEECIREIVSRLNPKQWCRGCAVSQKFSEASESDENWVRFLPPDWLAILSRSSAHLHFTSLKQLYLHLSDNPILIDSNSMALSFLYNSFTFTCWFGFWYLGLVSKPTLLSFQFLLSPNSIVNLHMPSRLKKINKLVKGCKWTNLSMTRTAQDKTCLCLFFLVNNPSSTSSLIWELTVYNTIIDLKLGCISL